MKREYLNGVRDDVRFFCGFETEKTIHYQKYTLFVVGEASLDEIEDYCKNWDITHVYLGANQTEISNWDDFSFLIEELLKKKYDVTVDLDHMHYEKMLTYIFTNSANLVLTISMKMPHVRTLPYNTYIKIDDKDFNHSNPGVWLNRLDSMLNHETFTSWSEYENDTVVD